jgi:hypothetical protein
MNSKVQNGKKSSYLVILLLVVGLTAFSSTMRELNQVREFLLDTSRLAAQASARISPNEIPHAIVKLETCDAGNRLQQSIPAVELPWLDEVQDETEPTVVTPRRVPQVTAKPRFIPAPPVKPGAAQLAKLEKLRRFEFDAKQSEVTMSSDHGAEPDTFIISDFPVTLFKTKTRKNGIKINPRDREMLLKTLNRSINLRMQVNRLSLPETRNKC